MIPPFRILVIDDEVGIRASLAVALQPGYEVHGAADGQEGLEVFRRELPHLVFLDIALPDIDGLTLLERIRAEDQGIPVIMLTAVKTVKTAVDAMKRGAADYLSKPFEIEELRLTVEKALAAQELEREVHYLRAQVLKSYAFHNILGKSQVMREVFASIAQIAQTRTTILLTGESGTGKELVARAIHFNSACRNGPFIAINCAALPEALIESELFGHERGAFTDAVARRIGKIELAQGGTFFLDEIGDLSLATQAKMLRFLQEREFVRVGGSDAIKANVRIIAATNRELESLIRRGEFRKDLYYRINVVSLHLPPLRERREDIPLLVKHFLDKHVEEDGRSKLEMSKDALALLASYPWPGNVRELENVIGQAVVWCQKSVITPDHLPPTVKAEARRARLREDTFGHRGTLETAVKAFEKELVLDALRRTGYIQTQAAALLGITRRVLKYRMDTLGITRPSSSRAPRETPRSDDSLSGHA